MKARAGSKEQHPLRYKSSSRQSESGASAASLEPALRVSLSTIPAPCSSLLTYMIVWCKEHLEDAWTSYLINGAESMMGWWYRRIDASREDGKALAASSFRTEGFGTTESLFRFAQFW